MSTLINIALIMSITGTLFSGASAAPIISLILLGVLVFLSYKRFQYNAKRLKKITKAREEAFLAIYQAQIKVKTNDNCENTHGSETLNAIAH